MSKPTANEDDPRAQPAAVGAWDNYVDPHPDGDEPRPSGRHGPAKAGSGPHSGTEFCHPSVGRIGPRSSKGELQVSNGCT